MSVNNDRPVGWFGRWLARRHNRKALLRRFAIEMERAYRCNECEKALRGPLNKIRGTRGDQYYCKGCDLYFCQQCAFGESKHSKRRSLFCDGQLNYCSFHPYYNAWILHLADQGDMEQLWAVYKGETPIPDDCFTWVERENLSREDLETVKYEAKTEVRTPVWGALLRAGAAGVPTLLKKAAEEGYWSGAVELLMRIDSPDAVPLIKRFWDAGHYRDSGSRDRDEEVERYLLRHKAIRAKVQPQFGDIVQDTKGKRWLVIRDNAKIHLGADGKIAGDIYSIGSGDEVIGKVNADKLRAAIDDRKLRGLSW